MSGPRTGQALRQVIMAALASLTFKRQKSDASGYDDVAMPNIIPRSPWNTTDARPDVYACFAIDSYGATNRQVSDRKMKLTFWISALEEDDCEEIYEAIRARVNLADQDAGFFATDLSRPGGVGAAAALAAVVRKCEERRAYPTDFNQTLARYMKVAEYDVVAL